MIKLICATDESIEFEITSSSRDTTHNVYWDVNNGWVCTCEHCHYRKVECKHIQACKDYLTGTPFTIVGVTVRKVLVYNAAAINHVINMGTFYEIKRQKEEVKKWKYQQEQKLKV